MQASGAVAPQFGDRVDSESDLEESGVEQLLIGEPFDPFTSRVWCAGSKCASGRLWTGDCRVVKKPVMSDPSVASLMVCESFLGILSGISFMLATGRLTAPPFCTEAMMRLRQAVAQTLPDPVNPLEVPERQPFFLHLLGQSLQRLGGPDWAILTQGEECYATGMALVKSRKLDQTAFDPIMSNYASAEMSSSQLEEQFRKDEASGMNPGS